MGKKVFLIDVNKCNGCYNCQIACKDEHCGADWMPYAKAQPDIGQFWCKVEQTVHGTVPKVNITYVPKIGAQDEALRAYAPELLMEREDGVVVIDPEKAVGRKDLAEKFDGVFYNEELQIPQGCTGCAHLLDDGWAVPRCVDSCATEALRFGDADGFAGELEKAERLTPASRVYYLNLPKRWVAGQVIDQLKDEVICGATVTLQDEQGNVLKASSDEFGDYWLKQIDGAKYHVWVEVEGYVTREMDVDCTDDDVNMGRVNMYTLDFK